MVETQLGDPEQPKTSIPLIITYSTLTCLVVGVHLLALMISTCILSVLETDGLLSFKEHETMQIYIEFAWILSSGFGKKLFISLTKLNNFINFNIGIFLFLLEITIICWVKFFSITHLAAIASTIIIIPIIILFFIFSLHYYRRLVILKLRHHQSEINEIEHRLTIIKLPIVNII
jgi:hypothetical protein